MEFLPQEKFSSVLDNLPEITLLISNYFRIDSLNFLGAHTYRIREVSTLRADIRLNTIRSLELSNLKVWIQEMKTQPLHWDESFLSLIAWGGFANASSTDVIFLKWLCSSPLNSLKTFLGLVSALMSLDSPRFLGASFLFL